MVIAVVSVILGIPILTIKLSMVGNAIIILFVDVILPLALGAFFIAGGPYDIIMKKLTCQ